MRVLTLSTNPPAVTCLSPSRGQRVDIVCAIRSGCGVDIGCAIVIGCEVNAVCE